MKKIIHNSYSILLFLVSISTWVASCSKDTPKPEPKPEELIIGKWYVIKITKADGTVQEPANDCEKGSYYNFNDKNEIDMVNFYLDGGECKRSSGWGEYYVVDGGTKLVVTASDGMTNTVNILTLNASALELNVMGDTMLLKKGS